ncbi:MAG: hypothetical protein J1F35_03345 [Erysipelotrichales bacterium]|nr:hypothetical protein [Erysipelotrichales bacterium]
MVSLQNFIVTESLDSEMLYWKMNTWYMGREDELNSFYSMMNVLANSPAVTLKDFEKVLKDYNLDWKQFVQFAIDNVDGTIEFDQLYTMKKIVDILLANKNYKWDLKDEKSI